MGFQMIWDGPAQGSKVKETDIACRRPARTCKGKKRKDISCLGPTQMSKEKKNRETNLPTSYYNTTHRLIDETLTPRSGDSWRTPWKILHFTLTFYKRQMKWSSRATCSLRPKIMQWLSVLLVVVENYTPWPRRRLLHSFIAWTDDGSMGHLLRQMKRKLLTVVKIAWHDVPARFFPPIENTFYYLGVYKWEKWWLRVLRQVYQEPSKTI